MESFKYDHINLFYNTTCDYIKRLSKAKACNKRALRTFDVQKLFCTMLSSLEMRKKIQQFQLTIPPELIEKKMKISFLLFV
jgi:hypothetical protein